MANSPDSAMPGIPAGGAPGAVSTGMFMGIARGLLITAGTVLVDRKILDAEALQQIVGAILIAGPIAWSAYVKWRAEGTVRQRETVAVQAGAQAAFDGKLLMTQPDSIGPAHAQALIREAKEEKLA